MFYFVKTPWLLKKIYPETIWDIPAQQPRVFLTFDDGPHPSITDFVLEQLQQYHAKASFFCIGKNVEQNPQVFQRIMDAGHAVGNHTQQHLNGWKTADSIYIDNIAQASKHINSHLFRPPYGRIRKSQLRLMKEKFPGMKTIMWDVLSADFDVLVDSDKCVTNVLRHTKPGSIIVFHDSEKAFPRLEKALPVVLENLCRRGFELSPINV